VVVIVVVIVLG